MTSASTAAGGGIDWADPGLNAIRRDMLRFARLQLRDEGAAEDAVQEALLAAMRHESGFEGRAALKTWIFAILRNKIVDQLRRSPKELPASALTEAGCEECGAADIEQLFDQRGHWTQQDKPSAWADPEASLSQKQFWNVFDACINHLPENTARVFMMREFLDLETPEICTQLGITTNNCWVILHRARISLRECLENRWFDAEPQPC